MDGLEPDDSRFDAAPVPPHERVWRHPSEVGEIHWRKSEPPLTIGRGLLFTTGAIGGLLALAVLWTTLPTGAGSSVAVVSTQAARPARVSTTPASSGLVNSEGPPTGSQPVRPPAVDPVETTQTLSPAGEAGAVDLLAGPPTTLHLSGTSPRSGASSVERSAVAVLVGATPVVITTAGAIDPDDVVTLTSGDGGTRTAKVMLIYRGVAVLEPDSDVGSTTLALGSPTHAGDMVTVVGSTPVAVPIAQRSDGGVQIDRWGDSDAPEGAPVIDHAGQLVGLCRHAEAGPEMVVVDGDALRSMVGVATSGPKAGSGEAPAAPATTVLGGSSTSTPGIASTPPSTAGSPTVASATPPSSAPTSSTAPAAAAAAPAGQSTTTAAASAATPLGSLRPGGWLGIQLDASAASATVVHVDPDGPAAAAGLHVGDTIVAVDGTTTPSAADLAGLLVTHLPGDVVRVTVRRTNASAGSPTSTDVATTAVASTVTTAVTTTITSTVTTTTTTSTTVSLIVTLATPPTAA